MSMTNEQRERLLGQIAMGATLKTACATLGITYLDLIMAWDSDRVFRVALASVQDMRDMVTLLSSPAETDRLHDELREMRARLEDDPDL